MSDHTDPLEAVDLDGAIVEALASGLSYRAAGEVCGCSAKTIQRRMQDPSFRDAVAQRRAALVAELVGRLSRVGQRAIDALEEILVGEESGLRLQAAQMTFTSLLRVSQHVDLERRLRNLEHERGGARP